jgi:hypothetical protein
VGDSEQDAHHDNYEKIKKDCIKDQMSKNSHGSLANKPIRARTSSITDEKRSNESTN